MVEPKIKRIRALNKLDEMQLYKTQLEWKQRKSVPHSFYVKFNYLQHFVGWEWNRTNGYNIAVKCATFNKNSVFFKINSLCGGYKNLNVEN